MRAFVFASGDFQTTSDPGELAPAGATEAETPAGVALDALVWDGTALVDRASVATWYVDPHGTRRAFRGDLAWTVFAGAYADPTLADLKVRLRREVDARAEALRLCLITPGSGQAMEYQEAFNEAVQVSNILAADPDAAIDAGRFPMLAASIGFDRDPRTGAPSVDLPGEARAVLAAFDAYQRAGAAIRRVRLAGKAAIAASGDATAARAAAASIAWPILG